MMQPTQKPQQRTLRLLSREPVTPKVVHAVFEPVSPPEILFDPGQYCSYFIAPTERRNFSLAMKPYGKQVELFVDTTPLGLGTQWLLNLKVGDLITCMGPLGRFILDTTTEKTPVFVATGTGITPFRSMIHTFHEKFPDKPFSLYWGLRNETDIFWHDELNGIAQAHSNFHFTLALSQPSETWAGKRGRVTEHIFSEMVDFSQSIFYLCGNRNMIREVTEGLLSRGVVEADIRTEIYF